ncbi:MAG: dephospho-CoA kinase [Bacilli bacterium]|nr:dephospho-CoA kinase [Bacilli bacterium]
MLISICGKSGSGKSTLAKQLNEEIKDSILLDIDKIAHNIYNIDACKEEMIAHYGDYILTNNEINRKILSKIVFTSEKEMQVLEEITWKYMERIMDYQIDKYKDKVIILEWINLPKTKYLKESKIRILLDTPDSIRKERVLKRDKITEEDYEIRDSAALTYDKSEFNIILKEINEETIERIKKEL